MTNKTIHIAPGPTRTYQAPWSLEPPRPEYTSRLTGCVLGLAEYEMYGGNPKGGWMERVTREALEAAVGSKAILNYNHQGMPLASTNNDNLKLWVNDEGLQVEAIINNNLARRLVDDWIPSATGAEGVLEGYKWGVGFRVGMGGQEWSPPGPMQTRVINQLCIEEIAICRVPQEQDWRR